MNAFILLDDETRDLFNEGFLGLALRFRRATAGKDGANGSIRLGFHV